MKRGFLNSSRYKQAIAADRGSKPASLPRKGGETTAMSDQNVHVADTPCLTRPKGDVARDRSDADVAFDAAKANAKVADADDNAMDTSPDGVTPIVDGDAKGKGKAINMDDFIEPETPSLLADGPTISRVPPRRPGWGRDPREDILHTVPQSHGGPHRRRCIFRQWPRASDGKPIMPKEKPKGKVSPDGYPWGATLYDFFAVNRIPPHFGVVSYMTGSALLEEMKEMGELDAAAPEIEWAESEGEPRDEGVADTAELVLSAEGRTRIGARFSDVFVVNLGEPDEGQEDEQDDDDDNDENAKDTKVREYIVDPGPIPPPPTIPVTSPFHPSHYPKPWPLVPFDKSGSPVLLQDRIPLYLLPQTLYVHDPFNLLSAREQTFRDTQWNSRPDIIRTYNLAVSESVHKEAAEARKKAEEVEEFKARTLIFLRYIQTKEQIENFEPRIEVPLPPYPRRLTTIEEAHLFISPCAKVGEGHHSVVYKGEWELPRDLYVRPTICTQCFEESAHKEIQRLKDTGRWEKLLRAASWGPKGHTGRKPTEAELAAANDPINLESDGEIIEREIICVVPTGVSPSRILALLDETKFWDSFMKNKAHNTAILNFTSGDKSTDDSLVPLIRLNPPFSYEDCTHHHSHLLGGDGPSPRTTKFTVTVKLSLPHDDHLTREADNYQQFPDHFFRHYSGYTIVAQLRAIAPVHALVPQFYGYYKPVQEDGQSRYLSPILLLEHCGQPIEPHTLSAEDQEECISMLLRFQRGGWLHESVFPRNFLVQRGMPTEFPLVRTARPELSFRLIDFGRSHKWTHASEKRGEEMEALGMFSKLAGQMAVTLW